MESAIKVTMHYARILLFQNGGYHVAEGAGGLGAGNEGEMSLSVVNRGKNREVGLRHLHRGKDAIRVDLARRVQFD